MNTPLVYPTCAAELSSGQPILRSELDLLRVWTLLNVLFEIDMISEFDVPDLLKQGAKGLRIERAFADDDFSVRMYVHSFELYEQLCERLKAHDLQWPDDLLILIHVKATTEEANL